MDFFESSSALAPAQAGAAGPDARGAAAAGGLSAQVVMAQFVGREHLANRALFEQLALQLEIPEAALDARAPVGQSGQMHNLFARKVRWHQQTLKRLGALERVERGTWRLSADARQALTPAPRRAVLLAFSTDLGCALWANAEDAFAGLGERITLAFTSPPYPLAQQRAYGNVEQGRYIDWLLPILEPIVAHLRPGGSLVLNLGNDIFVPGSPERSLYLERLTLALHDKLGLRLMDRIVWHNPTKPPGPAYWASIRRVHHNTAYEHVLWFTNDPALVRADNRRCLREHTEKHQRLMSAGGEKRHARHADGAHVVREGSFGARTEGAIARNVLSVAHRDRDQRAPRDFAKRHGLPAHPALMPLALAEHFVRFLSEEDDLVVDPFGGWATTGRAAEKHGRRWLVTERCMEYLIAAAQRFRGARGFQMSMGDGYA
jgi:site-specific DNA-methyltransferase (cytosine-N4-specific)